MFVYITIFIKQKLVNYNLIKNRNSCPYNTIEVHDLGSRNVSCVFGIGFTNNTNNTADISTSFSFMMINACNKEINVMLKLPTSGEINSTVPVTSWLYANSMKINDKFVGLNECITNNQYPWQCGPLIPQKNVTSTDGSGNWNTVLPPWSLVIGTNDV